jgi:hypothetical protein
MERLESQIDFKSLGERKTITRKAQHELFCSYIMNKTSYIRWNDDDDDDGVRFVQDQHV